MKQTIYIYVPGWRLQQTFPNEFRGEPKTSRFPNKSGIEVDAWPIPAGLFAFVHISHVPIRVFVCMFCNSNSTTMCMYSWKSGRSLIGCNEASILRHKRDRERVREHRIAGARVLLGGGEGGVWGCMDWTFKPPAPIDIAPYDGMNMCYPYDEPRLTLVYIPRREWSRRWAHPTRGIQNAINMLSRLSIVLFAIRTSFKCIIIVYPPIYIHIANLLFKKLFQSSADLAAKKKPPQSMNEMEIATSLLFAANCWLCNIWLLWAFYSFYEVFFFLV